MTFYLFTGNIVFSGPMALQEVGLGLSIYNSLVWSIVISMGAPENPFLRVLPSHPYTYSFQFVLGSRINRSVTNKHLELLLTGILD